ncbi:MAG: ankyrin repeat domain-containing protein [Treponema sp.]|nr:ankyrin repeat domain-containing protein [Treponema sp.]
MKYYYRIISFFSFTIIFGLFINISVDAQSRLLDAVIRGNLTQVRRLVASGADINLGNNTFTPLERAANDGRYEIVEYLLSLDAMNPQKAFEKAAANKHINVIRLLIASGKVDVNTSALYFRSFFNDQTTTFEQRMQTVYEITEGQLNSPYLLRIVEPENYQRVVEYFNINLSDRVDGIGRTILHIAAINNDVNLITYLLSKNININVLDNNNNTALIYCIMSFGPSVNWVNPIIEDAENVRINYISDMPYYLNPSNVKMRQAQVGVLLLNAGININLQNKYGWTALHFACASSSGARETLILRGANQNIRTNFGRMPNDLIISR